MKRIALILMAILIVAFPLFSQNVNIPDANFLSALIEEGVDTNGDSLISYAEAELVTELHIYNRAITDMTGIESFINLNMLNCPENQLTSLDVSGCTALTGLICLGNQLTSLDVSGCTALGSLHCYYNQLTSLDVSGCTALSWLECYYNQLTSLDVSGCDSLQWLWCSNNQLTSLDVTNNTALVSLQCSENQLTSLDVSNNTNLSGHNIWDIGLNCSNNQLTSLDVTNNTALVSLWCSENQLTSLDVTSNTALESFRCSENQLTSLDVSKNTGLYNLIIKGMPTLNQVCVWEMPFPPERVWIEMDGSPNVYFTTECVDFEAPYLIAVDSLFQAEYVEATSSEDGVIYLVPENTVAHLGLIRALCIDSVIAVSNTPANISLSGLDNGIYWLYARDSTGNISELKAITIMGVGFQQNRADQFRLYPNPSNDLLTIETVYSDNYLIEITFLNGQQILMGEMKGTSHQIDLSSLQKGIYFITIRSEDFVATEKIIKL
ncbi:MAG: T9SS type A sorting domain-containing protein [Bacteroidota bacterium]